MLLPSRHHPVKLRRIHKTCIALTQVRNTNKRHGDLKFLLHDVEEVLNALVAVIESVQKGSAEAHSGSSMTETLEHVTAAPYAAVDENFELVEDGGTVELAFE